MALMYCDVGVVFGMMIDFNAGVTVAKRGEYSGQPSQLQLILAYDDSLKFANGWTRYLRFSATMRILYTNNTHDYSGKHHEDQIEPDYR